MRDLKQLLLTVIDFIESNGVRAIKYLEEEAFLKHINWIIKELESRPQMIYLELDWFDDPTVIGLETAYKIKKMRLYK